MLTAQYDQDFYEQQMSGSYRSAQVFAGILTSMVVPRSVADLGCGRGTWLKAFGEAGARKLVGFDGAWNRQENMVDGSIVFNPWDLNTSIAWDSAEKFDLAMSLEVAEHLEPTSAPAFVSSLVSLSDLYFLAPPFRAREEPITSTSARTATGQVSSPPMPMCLSMCSVRSSGEIKGLNFGIAGTPSCMPAREAWRTGPCDRGHCCRSLPLPDGLRGTALVSCPAADDAQTPLESSDCQNPFSTLV